MQDSKFNTDDMSFAFITGVPFLVISMLVLWAGFYDIREIIGWFDGVSIEAYNIVKIALSAVVVMFAVVSVNRGWITEGIMFLFVGASSLTTAFSIKAGFDNVNMLDGVYGAIILICALFMIFRKARYRGFATFFIGFALLAPRIVGDFIPHFGGIMLIISGVIFFLYFAFVMLYLETGEERFNKTIAESDLGRVSNPYETVIIVGLLTVGLMLFLDGITEVTDAKFWRTSLSIAVFIFSIVAIVIAVYASAKGETAEAIFTLMIAIYYLFTMILVFFDQITVPMVIEVVTSAVILSTILVFYKRGNIPFTILATLAFIQGVFVSPIMGMDNTFLTGCFSIVESILCVYIAVSTWCVVELKKEFLPIFDHYRGDSGE